MKNSILKITLLTLVFAFTIQFGTSAMAFAKSSAPVYAAEAAQDAVTGEVTGYVVRNGKKQPANNVQPGETILWEVTLKNNVNQVISNIKYDSPVSEKETFVRSSESAPAEFSVDSKTFSRAPVVRDASGNTVAAPVSSFVAIRFNVSLNAGETKTLSYKTTVK